ncbi:MAG TPA: translesion error-prone DNA polymerase V autoproteolytic subunit [Patescibacteria group bacterium]|nr:translesion error-prone DNA polymerase V autoproteolytic subunit [Patescibacteria group bacterium]
MKATDKKQVDQRYSFEAPLHHAKVPAGLQVFPAQGSVLDLNTHLVHHPEATFLVRACGESMIERGIYDGDILIVDRAIIPVEGDVVIASLDGELTVKTLEIKGDRTYLVAANKKFLPLEITPFIQFQIWGVVVHVIHAL